jgi:hypothetical protein
VGDSISFSGIVAMVETEPHRGRGDLRPAKDEVSMVSTLRFRGWRCGRVEGTSPSSSGGEDIVTLMGTCACIGLLLTFVQVGLLSVIEGGCSVFVPGFLAVVYRTLSGREMEGRMQEMVWHRCNEIDRAAKQGVVRRIDGDRQSCKARSCQENR